MSDLTKLAEADSTQLNAIDLIGGSQRYKITAVNVKAGDQPVEISLEGVVGKVFRPCKSMIRVMIAGWGKEGDDYVGKEFDLYNDPDVTWAGRAEGGIRISAMSEIKGGKDLKLMLTVSRGKKKPCTIKLIETAPRNKLTDEVHKSFTDLINASTSMSELQKVGKSINAGYFTNEGSDKLTAEYKTASARIRLAN